MDIIFANDIHHLKDQAHISAMKGVASEFLQSELVLVWSELNLMIAFCKKGKECTEQKGLNTMVP